MDQRKGPAGVWVQQSQNSSVFRLYRRPAPREIHCKKTQNWLSSIRRWPEEKGPKRDKAATPCSTGEGGKRKGEA